MNTQLRSLALCAMVAMTAAPAIADDDKQITFGTMAWEDLKVLTLIAKAALEDKGYTVDVTEFSEWGIAYAALAKGDVEVLVSQTDYIAQDYWDKNKRNLDKTSVISHGVYQAFAVPEYVDIDSTEQLNDNAALLGGKIIGVEPGSGLMREAAVALEEYDLQLELIEGSTAGMTAALDSAIKRKEPIVVTLWDPSWMFSKYDVKFLDDPKHVFAPPQAYHVILNKGFAESHPEANELLGAIYVDLASIRQMTEAMEDGKTAEQAAQDWIDANPDLMARWGNIKAY